MSNSTNITDDQINALYREAEGAGDSRQMVICMIALGNPTDPPETMTQDQAREACAEAIAAAEAMAD